jgi:UDP-N-acetylmuramoyl-L-alanyl-D-glutamate--2,6-diaminopimelate ligase
MGPMASRVHGDPSADLAVVGVTGTNGKTTVTHYVESLVVGTGHPTGLIGTVHTRVGENALSSVRTTPEATDFQRLLAEMRVLGAEVVAAEVSSHALEMSRVAGTTFEVAAFTNLSQDHLDFHGTMEEYAKAKGRLFTELLPAGRKPGATAVLNADDPVGAAWATALSVRVITFGLGPGHAVRPRHFESGLEGIRLLAESPAGPVHIVSPLIGEHNVMNLLGAVGTGVALGLGAEAIAAALGEVTRVPGRFERVEAGQDFLVVVDYAHTPDALERVLETARRLTPGRLGVVFGAGGDRDRGKRPVMGRIAARLADRVWLTSDNPRSEDPAAIIDEIATGVAPPPTGGYARYPDRRQAIRDAVDWARLGDTIVIAGKGHETYQIVGGQVSPFDDRLVAHEALAGRAPGGGAPCRA